MYNFVIHQHKETKNTVAGMYMSLFSSCTTPGGGEDGDVALDDAIGGDLDAYLNYLTDESPMFRRVVHSDTKERPKKRPCVPSEGPI